MWTSRLRLPNFRRISYSNGEFVRSISAHSSAPNLAPQEWMIHASRLISFVSSNIARMCTVYMHRKLKLLVLVRVQLTPPNLEWREARSYCLRRGGDLAEFTLLWPFKAIIETLDPSTSVGNIPSAGVPIWFRWYSWDNMQRTPKNYNAYTEGFQCIVFDHDGFLGRAPLSYCSKGSKSKKTRGLCSLPPPGDAYSYQASKCPNRCAIGYENYCWNETNADTTAKKECPTGLQGTATWSCGIDGEWSTVSPNLRYIYSF